MSELLQLGEVGAVALAIGFVLGLLGGGGSALAVPALIFLLGFGDKEAIATSLLVVAVTAALAAAQRAARGALAWRPALRFALGAAPAAWVGSQLARLVPGRWLIALFALTMLVSAVALWRKARGTAPVLPSSRTCPACLALGAAAGLLTGLVGAGGGFVVVPALILVGGMLPAEAVGASLLVVALQSAVAFVGYAGHVAVDFSLVAWMAAAAAGGALLGAPLAERLRGPTLQRLFAALIGILALLLISRAAGARLGAMWGNPYASGLLGGLLIGTAAGVLWWRLRRVAGISGILAESLRGHFGPGRFRLGFLLGLLAGGVSLRLFYPSAFDASQLPALPLALGAGLLVGVGTGLGAGCTSGHGVCGLGRLSKRSLVAVLVFMATGVATVALQGSV